jgi:transcription antitermination protein NusB
MAVGTRREARERALSLLYEADAKDVPVTTVVNELPLPPDPFVIDLVRGVEGRLVEIDTLIARYAIDWSLERMPVIDRTLLRMATYELLARLDIPIGAVISEAVDLAKVYSTEESGRFVNGMLSSIAAAARRPDEAVPETKPAIAPASQTPGD